MYLHKETTIIINAYFQQILRTKVFLNLQLVLYNSFYFIYFNYVITLGIIILISFFFSIKI